jgi:hypothetical protein
MHSSVADQRISWRPATAADVQAYYGSPPAQTMCAVVIFMGEEVAGILGVVRHENHAQFFSEFREALRPHLRTLPVMRAIKRAQEMISGSKLPVFAIAEETEADAVRILTRLGFVHHQESIYLWHNSRPSSPTS